MSQRKSPLSIKSPLSESQTKQKNHLLFTSRTDFKKISIVRLSGKIQLVNTNDLKRAVRIIERLWTKKVIRRFLDTNKFLNKEMWALWQLKDGIRGEFFRNYYVIHANPFMMKLPLEIITIIIGFLNYHDFVTFGQVSKSIYCLLRLPVMKKQKASPIDNSPPDTSDKLLSMTSVSNEDPIGIYGDNENKYWSDESVCNSPRGDSDSDEYGNDYGDDEDDDNEEDKSCIYYNNSYSFRQQEHLAKKHDWEEYGKEDYEYESAYDEFMHDEN